MKILLIQERGRHEKNREFRECENFKRAFNKLGVESEVWGLNYENFKTPFDEIAKKYDVILSIENYDSGWVPDLTKYSDKLRLFWSVDSHCALPAHLKTVSENKFDLVLNSIEHHQEYFKKFAKTFYLPNAYPDDLIFPKENIEKEHNIGFCGSLISDREAWLNFISQKHSIKRDIFILGDDMVSAINSYKLNFNKTLADDINYRVFETMGCKTALITNKPPGIENFFKDNEQIIYYNNPNELIEKIDYYLLNETKLKQIAENGYNEVKKKHTYLERAKTLIELINKNIR